MTLADLGGFCWILGFKSCCQGPLVDLGILHDCSQAGTPLSISAVFGVSFFSQPLSWPLKLWQLSENGKSTKQASNQLRFKNQAQIRNQHIELRSFRLFLTFFLFSSIIHEKSAAVAASKNAYFLRFPNIAVLNGIPLNNIILGTLEK